MRFRGCILAAVLASLRVVHAQSDSLTASAFDALGNDLTAASASLDVFDLTMLANQTHVLTVFNISDPLSKVGWAAFGVGTKMMNADMIIGWPLRQASGGNTSWMISHRTSTGHSQPQAFPTNQQTSEFSIFYPLTTTDSSGKYTTLAILRTLEPTWPTDATYVNITRAKSQSIIWAYGSDRPVGSDYQANVPQHDSFGRTSFDLSQTITNPAVSSGNDGTSSGNSTTTIPQVQEGDTSSQEWTKHDWLVAMHATFGCLAWLIVSPAAILLGRLGRKYSYWFRLHQIFQSGLTAPLTLVSFVLGVYAVKDSETGDFQSGHKQVGLLLLILLFGQLALGWYSHHKYNPRRSSRPWQNILHIVLGLTLTCLGFAQVFTGFSEYKENFQRTTPGGIYALFYIIVAAVILAILISLGMLVQQRKQSGLNWKNATLGLGRDAASPQRDMYGLRTAKGQLIRTHVTQDSMSTINTQLSDKW